MNRGRLVTTFALASIAAAVLHVGCGSSPSSQFNGGGDGGGSSTDGAPRDGTVSDGSLFGGDGSACTGNGACEGGTCVSGQCCAAQDVCGSSCCGSGEVCLFDTCVVPGAPCQTSDQCGMGKYCEPGLGGGDAGAPPPADSGCTNLPVTGRCLPLPPTCPGDAGVEPDGGACLEQCEYHPSGSGSLNAKVKWQWGPTAKTNPSDTDVWSTPTVGRMYDTNCDGTIDHQDSPVIVFISGDVQGTCCQCTGTTPTACHTGVVRMINGSSGQEIWSLAKASPTSSGFEGLTPALGDVDNDGVMDIVTVTGEGYVVLIDHDGNVKRTSDKPIPGNASGSFGWGGGIALADMDVDGHTEIAFGSTVFTTTNGAITLAWTGANGQGGGDVSEFTSAFSDVDGAPNGYLELVAGNTAYQAGGAVLWHNATLPDGFPGVGDFDKNGKPEVVLVSGGKVWVLDGATGNAVATLTSNPFTLPGNGSGGAPTIADFDGDGFPEIGVAQQNKYTVIKPSYKNGSITQLWTTDNHDFSSAVTGSTVFDFEGDGVAEVVYADECWLWVFEGPTGAVRLAYSHSSFTGTEAAMVADIDGDGHAEMLIPSNGVNMKTWDCESYQTTKMNGVNWTPGPAPNLWYRGLVALGDSADSWVGTRTLWTEHTYHVTNVCDDTDNACTAPNTYGSIPKKETKNWSLPWLNDFRQNVQDHGIFNAPDAVVAMSIDCNSPPTATVQVRNVGQAGLPAGVEADVYTSPGNVKVGSVTTTIALLPGQTQSLTVTLKAPAMAQGTFYAKIYVDPTMPKFHECNPNNDTSATVTAHCSQ